MRPTLSDLLYTAVAQRCSINKPCWDSEIQTWQSAEVNTLGPGHSIVIMQNGARRIRAFCVYAVICAAFVELDTESNRVRLGLKGYPTFEQF